MNMNERFSFNEGFFGDLKNKIMGNKNQAKPAYKITDPQKIAERKAILDKCIAIIKQQFAMIKDPVLKRSINLFNPNDQFFKKSLEDFIHGDDEMFIGDWELSSYTKDTENDIIMDEFEDKREALYKTINPKLKSFKMTIDEDCCEYDYGSIVLFAEKGFQESALIIDDGRFHF